MGNNENINTENLSEAASVVSSSVSSISLSDRDKLVQMVLGEISGPLREEREQNSKKVGAQGKDAQERLDILDKLNENNGQDLEDLVGGYVDKLPEESIRILAKGGKVNGNKNIEGTGSSYTKLAFDILRGVENFRKDEIESAREENRDPNFEEADVKGLENFAKVGNLPKYVQRNFDFINSDIQAILEKNAKSVGLKVPSFDPRDKNKRLDNMMLISTRLGGTGLDKASAEYMDYEQGKARIDEENETLSALQLRELYNKEDSLCKPYLEYKNTVSHLVAGMVMGLVEGKNPPFTLGENELQPHKNNKKVLLVTEKIPCSVSAEVLTAITDAAAELAKDERYKGLGENGLLLAGRGIAKAMGKDLKEADMDLNAKRNSGPAADMPTLKLIVTLAAKNIQHEEDAKKPNFTEKANQTRIANNVQGV